jgi:hypothetical protein
MRSRDDTVPQACDLAQNMLHDNIVEPGNTARRSKILHDVTTAPPNPRFDRCGIPLLMVPTARELVAKMFNLVTDNNCDHGPNCPSRRHQSLHQLQWRSGAWHTKLNILLCGITTIIQSAQRGG